MSDKMKNTESSDLDNVLIYGLGFNLGILLALVYIVAHFLIIFGYRAIVLSLLWHWFVVDNWDVAELSITAAIGIVLITSLLTRTIPPNMDESSQNSSFDKLFWQIVQATVILSMGFVVNLLF